MQSPLFMPRRSPALAGSLAVALAVGACGKGAGDGNRVGDTEVPTSTTDPSQPQTATDAYDPGRKTLHRLNRAEYDNTVRDLLGGIDLGLAATFPADDHAAGYDNIATNLSMSPLHVEMYELAAFAVADEILYLPTADAIDVRIEAESAEAVQTAGGPSGSGTSWNLWSNGSIAGTFDAPIDGTYTLSARVWGQQGGPDLVQAAIGHDGFVDQTFDVAADDESQAEVLSVDVELTAGRHQVEVSFLNDYYDPKSDPPVDRNMVVDWVGAEGPADLVTGDNPLRESIVGCIDDADEACARATIEAFGPKAWRRPLEAAEIEGLMGVYEAVTGDGGDFEDGLRHMLAATLLSPHFLYRVELDDDPASATITNLSDYEVASRLSYMLWSSMPDEALFEAAANGELQTDEGIRRQVERMVADPKSVALIDNFAGQWLYLRAIDSVAPDPAVYPNFDEVLRASMKLEVERFVASFVGTDRDMRELMSATEGEVDAILAAHYDLAPPADDWGTVDLASVDRGGLLGMAGLLTVNSYPARTSPVIRGHYVLGQLMCQEPPPPPAGVEGLEEDIDAQSVREQLEQHRADPVCASCHVVMDEIGFGLEHFDVTGAWRDEDRGLPVDASGTLPGEVTFYGARELSDLLAADPAFPHCMAEQLFTYGLGRVPGDHDERFLEDVDAAFAAGGYTFVELATAIAISPPFRTRRGEP